MKYGIEWTTHMPVLMKLMKQTHGPILELGAGLYSTPFLHWACYDTKTELVSMDNSPEFVKFMSQYANDYHKIVAVDDWDKADIEKRWSIVFVDHAPDIRRSIDAGRVAKYAEYVVLHDSQPANDPYYHYPDIYPLFKYRYDFTDVMPNTTVLSNYNDLKDFHV